MLIHQLPLDAAFASLRSSLAGLSSAEAGARRLEFGPNRIERLPKTPLALRFVGQFTHFFAVLLWVAALLAPVANVQMPGQGMATLAFAIVAVIVINGAFSFWQKYRAEETMPALRRLLPHQVRVQRDGAVVVLPSQEVVPGDVMPAAPVAPSCVIGGVALPAAALAASADSCRTVLQPSGPGVRATLVQDAVATRTIRNGENADGFGSADNRDSEKTLQGRVPVGQSAASRVVCRVVRKGRESTGPRPAVGLGAAFSPAGARTHLLKLLSRPPI